MDSLEEKEKLLLRIVWYFNDKQEKELRKYLNSLTKEQKEEFFESIQREGIYIHNPPLWEAIPLFDRLRDLYKEFDWIKPYDVYVNRFGRRIKVMKPLVVGDMYVIKLKQTSKKGFSVRSTGSLSKKGVPEKSNKAKDHQELYSKTPIRIGDQENINSAIGVPMDIIAQLHLFYRSSVLGRRHLGKKLAKKIKEIDHIEYLPEFTNRNVEILQAYLKAMGLRIEFSDDKMYIDICTDEIKDFELDDVLFIGTKEEFEDMKLEYEIRKKYAEKEVFVGTPEEFEELIQKEKEKKKKQKGKYLIEIDL